MIDSTKKFLHDDYNKIMDDIKQKINTYIHIAIAWERMLRNKGLESPLKNLILFFSKDKNQIEKFPLSDFFSRLQSTLGISAFIFSYFRS